MPSSLARVLSSALDYSSHPPELVSGTVCVPYAEKLFLAAWTQRLQGLRPRTRISTLRSGDLPPLHAYLLTPGIPTPGPSILLRPSITRTHKYPNINGFPISYALQPRLRGRLTLGRLPLPRNPWVYGERVFHPFYRYSCQHYHFSTVHHSLRNSFFP